MYGLNSPRVFEAMLRVPRDVFVPRKYKGVAYEDRAIPIGYGQMLSQPYTAAFMTDLLSLNGDEKVLEIGTGSGYQAAVLSMLAKEVYTIEIIPELFRKSKKILKELKYKNIWLKKGTGEWGWEEHAPYDAVIVTAAIRKNIPQMLFDQLKTDGVLIAPVGKGSETIMTKFTKRSKNDYKRESFGPFYFVPFVEEAS